MNQPGMKDLTRAHIDDYRQQSGIVHLRDADTGWLIGVVGNVTAKLDPLRSIEVSGTYADGSPVERMIVEVPASVCAQSPLAIMDYIIQHYGITA